MTARERELLDDIITDFGNIVNDFRDANYLEIVAYGLDMAERLARGYKKEIRQVIGTDNYDKRVKLFPIK